MQTTQPHINLTTQEAQDLTSWTVLLCDVAESELKHSGISGTVKTRAAEIERLCRPGNREQMQPSPEQVKLVTAILTIANDRDPGNPLQDSDEEIRASIASKFLAYCQAKHAALGVAIAQMEEDRP